MTTRTGALLFAGCVAAVLLLPGDGPARAEDASPRAVVELFTSQGCGRCPPADALLETLGRDPGLVTLSFAVDYWDYLGWKDTAARPEFTRRQRAYAERRGDRAVYTPQVVIDGRVHVVGSDRGAIESAIAELAAEKEAPNVPVDVETTADALIVRVADAPPSLAQPHATVWLARFETARTVPIRNGENSGRTVTYSHLVRSLQPIGMWKGKAIRIELPRRDTAPEGADGCAVLVQVDDETGPGAILGARLIGRGNS